MDNLRNLAYSTVATPPSPDTSGTSLICQTGQGANFPSGPFDVSMWPAGQIPVTSNCEIARATVAGDTFTLVRARYGTSAQPVAAGYQIAQTITANLISQILAASDPVGSAANAQTNAENYADNGDATWVATAKAYTDSSITALLGEIFRVGDIYSSTNSTMPAVIAALGTWVAIAGGRQLVGVGTGTDINGATLVVSASGTGSDSVGEYKHKLAASENAQHNHGGQTSSGITGSTSIVHYHTSVSGAPFLVQTTGGAWDVTTGPVTGDLVNYNASTANADVIHQHSVPQLNISTDPASTTAAHNNVSPFYGLYVWKRTA